MAAPRPKSRDFGAAMAGLVLGGSVMFLIILTIVWLTNSHFAEKKANEAKEQPQAVAPASPTPSPASGTPAPAPAKH